MLRLAQSLVIAITMASVCASTSDAQTAQQRFHDHGVRLSFAERTRTCTQNVTATWGVATDGRLSATSYRIVIRLLHPVSSYPVIERTSITPVTIIDVPLRPTSQDSIGLQVTVWATRNAVEGVDSVYGVRWLRSAPGVVCQAPTTPASLDTVNIFRFADGRLRPTLTSVDSSSGGFIITRDDPTYPMRPYVMRVSTMTNYGGPTPQLVGALVYAPSAPCTTPELKSDIWQTPFHLVRWNPKIFPYPNAQPNDRNHFYPAREMLAMAAQLTVDSLSRIVKHSIEQFIREDYPIVSGLNYSYERCYGPLSGLPPLDTVSPLHLNGALRSTIERVDSSQFGEVMIDRADAGYPQAPSRVWVYTKWANAHTDSAHIAGAVIHAPGTPCTHPVQYPSAVSAAWDASWGIVKPDPTALPYVDGQSQHRLLGRQEALAIAAQAPMHVLRRLSQLSRRAEVLADSAKLPVHLGWYRECYGDAS